MFYGLVSSAVNDDSRPLIFTKTISRVVETVCPFHRRLKCFRSDILRPSTEATMVRAREQRKIQKRCDSSGARSNALSSECAIGSLCSI